jgi:hypothetical protein
MLVCRIGTISAIDVLSPDRSWLESQQACRYTFVGFHGLGKLANPASLRGYVR